MTEENLNIVITNGYCCSAQKAVQLSKLLSIGNKCTKKEELELLVLVNSLNALDCYDFASTTNYLTIDELNKLTQIVMDICGICNCQLN